MKLAESSERLMMKSAKMLQPHFGFLQPLHKIELMLHVYWLDIFRTQFLHLLQVKSQRLMQQLLQRKQRLLFEMD